VRTLFSDVAALRQAMVRDLFFNRGEATSAAMSWLKGELGLP
jgi:hypothetical protein